MLKSVMCLPRNSLVAALSALLLVIMSAAPALADTSLGETGVTGYHALRDSSRRACSARPASCVGPPVIRLHRRRPRPASRCTSAVTSTSTTPPSFGRTTRFS